MSLSGDWGRDSCMRVFTLKMNDKLADAIDMIEISIDAGKCSRYSSLDLSTGDFKATVLRFDKTTANLEISLYS
jgi:hypothetical protein